MHSYSDVCLTLWAAPYATIAVALSERRRLLRCVSGVEGMFVGRVVKEKKNRKRAIVLGEDIEELKESSSELIECTLGKGRKSPALCTQLA